MKKSILEIIRNRAFWILDYFKGSQLSKNYRDIKFILDNFDTAESLNRRNRYLSNILKHAVDTTPFYIAFKGFKTLQDFPIINKSIIKNSPDKFISDNYDVKSLHITTTSGSTGTPFKVYHDKCKRFRHTADNIFFNELAKLKFGERLYYLRIWNVLNKKNFFKTWILNWKTIEASALTSETTNNLIKELENDSSTKSLLAYASTYEALAKNISEKYNLPLNLKVKSIISMSESLSEKAKEILQYFFSCPAISRYSNMENGFIAQQLTNNEKEYHINYASYHVELLNLDEDTPVEMGEKGRIVVTDLFNFGMPFIRYDTGDVGILGQKQSWGKDATIFENIEGRKVDFISDVNGNLLSPHVITNTMWKYPEIIQFQFIQRNTNDYLMKINCPKFEPIDLCKIEIEFKKYLGENAQIVFENVDEIPLLASGKRKKIINLMNS